MDGLDGGHGQSSQLANFWKIAKMALFNPWIFFSQVSSFEVLWRCHQVTLSKKCLRLRPSAKTEDKKG